MYTIKATAPTAHQLTSLRRFGMEVKKHLNGSFSAQQEFETEEEAKGYLRKRADMYNMDDPEGGDERLAEMYDNIEHGSLRLDAAYATIEESYEEE